MPTVAVCLLGWSRTFSLPCTGRTTLKRIVRPLDGTLFAFVNVPQQWSQTQIVRTRSSIAKLARSTGVYLAVNEVVNNVPNSSYRGMAQYHGLQRCWTVASQTALFETIIRVQTDVFYGFRLSPQALAYINSANIIYAGWIGAPSCGETTRSSAKRKRAHAVDDRFAIVHGRLAQRAYFSEFSETLAEFADLAAVRKRNVGHPTPECLLGMAINDVNDEVSNRPDLQIRLRDLRDLANNYDACTKAHTQISRSNCSAELSTVHWVCPL